MNNHLKLRGYSCIGLHNPKNCQNVGHVLRAAGCYDAKGIFFSGERYKKSATDTMKQYRHIPLVNVANLQNVIPYDCIPVAVELIKGGILLNEYQHPRSAYYIFGAEDETLGPDILSWCKDVVYVPTIGCMNLAATVNVVLYDRLSKHLNKLQSNGALDKNLVNGIK